MGYSPKGGKESDSTNDCTTRGWVRRRDYWGRKEAGEKGAGFGVEVLWEEAEGFPGLALPQPGSMTSQDLAGRAHRSHLGYSGSDKPEARVQLAGQGQEAAERLPRQGGGGSFPQTRPCRASQLVSVAWSGQHRAMALPAPALTGRYGHAV